MLSERVIKMAEKVLEDFEQLNELVSEETDDIWHVCMPGYIQLSTSSGIGTAREQDKQSLEELVGPVKFFFNSKTCTFYEFKLGKVQCCAAVDKVKVEGADE